MWRFFDTIQFSSTENLGRAENWKISSLKNEVIFHISFCLPSSIHLLFPSSPSFNFSSSFSFEPSTTFLHILGDLHGKFETLTLHDLGIVDVEEVRVHNRLQNTSQNRNVVRPAFEKVTIDPVRNVQCSVNPQCKNVMSGDVLRRARSLQHIQLRNDCNRLQPNRKRPCHLSERVGVSKNQRHHSWGNYQVPNGKRVDVLADGFLVFSRHQINRVCGRPHEEKFHERVVKREVTGKHIEVSQHEHNHVKNLRTQGQAIDGLITVYRV